MPPDWLRIRQERSDLTDYVLHWTKPRVSGHVVIQPFEVLKEIILCGHLNPSFAMRTSRTAGVTNRTILGPYPAVCFSEQPLREFAKSCEVLSDRCQPYAVAFAKRHLFQYGGRPAIYGTEDLLNALGDEHKHLWVRYSPIQNTSMQNFPIDWTHEREWRSTTHAYSYAELGEPPTDGIPLLLPPVYYPVPKKFVIAMPTFLVKTVDEARILKGWLTNGFVYRGGNEVMKYYYTNLPKASVVALDMVDQKIATGDTRWARIETLPFAELGYDGTLPTLGSYLS